MIVLSWTLHPVGIIEALFRLITTWQRMKNRKPIKTRSHATDINKVVGLWIKSISAPYHSFAFSVSNWGVVMRIRTYFLVGTWNVKIRRRIGIHFSCRVNACGASWTMSVDWVTTRHGHCNWCKTFRRYSKHDSYNARIEQVVRVCTAFDAYTI